MFSLYVCENCSHLSLTVVVQDSRHLYYRFFSAPLNAKCIPNTLPDLIFYVSAHNTLVVINWKKKKHFSVVYKPAREKNTKLLYLSLWLYLSPQWRLSKAASPVANLFFLTARDPSGLRLNLITTKSLIADKSINKTSIPHDFSREHTRKTLTNSGTILYKN